MRVLHIVDSLRVGGAERLVAGLVRELAEQRLARNAVCAFSAPDADPGLAHAVAAAAERVVLAGPSRLYDPRLPAAVLRLAVAFRPDVVHSHLSGANLLGRLVAAGLRRPHVTTVHTVPGPRSEDRPLRRVAERLTAPLSTLVTAPSPEVAGAYAAANRLPAARVRVLPNAPVAEAPPPGFAREKLRAELLGGAPGPLVVCVSRLEPEKGLDDLLDAAASVRRRLPGVRVVVAGDGSQRDRLAARLEAEPLGDTTTLLGPRADVGQLLCAADAFCLPSRYEGVPLSLLEALDAGLPCVTTAVGGIPGIVEHERTALLVAPARPQALAAALERVLSDGALAERLGRASAQLVRGTYSLQVLARRYADLYRELATGGRTAASPLRTHSS